MKTLAALAIGALSLSTVASAQTRPATPETATALKCLLDHVRDKCSVEFAGSASIRAKYWLWWNDKKDFALGPLLSSDYAKTEPQNGYTTRVLGGRTADLYDVRFRHQKLTFYIVPPGPDGKIRYIHIRDGTPDDEKMYGFTDSRIR